VKLLALLLTTSMAVPAMAQAAAPPAERQSIEAQLQELRAMREGLAKQMNTFDGRIGALEAQLQAAAPKAPAATTATAAMTTPATGKAPAAETSVATATPLDNAIKGATKDTGDAVATTATVDTEKVNILNPKTWGKQEPGKGFVLARTDKGEMDVTLVTYFRYLNQTGLDPTYTDYFGKTTTLDRKEDFQLNKVNMTFKGWLYDERFRYLIFFWTNNSAVIDGGQMYIAGNLSFKFSDAFQLGMGVDALPTTRTTTGNYPNWLRNDNRLMADEFFRGSFTTGVWLEGAFGKSFQYRAMVGNNLSTIGIGASQLAPGLNTASAYLRWMPSTGEFGPAAGFGDYEYHDQVATLLEAHYTYSREDAQEQPGTETIENSQIRLSDGGRLFDPGVFGTQYSINKATYQMAAATAAVKYKGFSLEGEYYRRWVNDFETTGPLPYTKLFDTGIGIQASAMVVLKKLQAYATFSQIWGEFGNPTEVEFGLNWYPLGVKNVRISPNALWMQKSPIGYSGVPWAIGGRGWVFTLDAALAAF
jgi:hypothetical protein